MYIYLEILNLHVETYIEKLRASTIPWLTSNYASGAEKKKSKQDKKYPYSYFAHLCTVSLLYTTITSTSCSFTFS